MPLVDKPRTMIFIDGGYLRETLRDITGDDQWNIVNFIESVHGELDLYEALIIGGGLSISNHLRTYYYDANYNKDDSNFEEIKEEYEINRSYFESLMEADFVEVKLGQLIKTGKRNRQKGVDALIAIDMLTKAYMDHYDVAILVSGDGDLLPLVKTVKDITGKHVYGVIFEKRYSEDMKRAFDKYLILNSENLGILRSLITRD